jgi:hypothetical protein
MKQRFTIILGLSLAASLSLQAQRNQPRPEFNEPKVEAPDRGMKVPGRGIKDDARGGIADAKEGVSDARKAFDDKANALRLALREALATLGKRPTREQVNEAVKQFKLQHADKIAAQKQQGIELAKAKRDNVSHEMKQKRNLLAEASRAKKSARDDLKKAIQGADTREEKDALLESFRADQQERHRDLKEQLKKLHDEVRGQKNDGNRRNDG